MGIKRTSVLRIILQNPCLKKCPQYWGHSSWTFSTFVPNIQYICPQRLGHFLTYSFWPLIININACFLYLSRLSLLQRLLSVDRCLLSPFTLIYFFNLPRSQSLHPRDKSSYIPRQFISQGLGCMFQVLGCMFRDLGYTFVRGERNFYIGT